MLQPPLFLLFVGQHTKKNFLFPFFCAPLRFICVDTGFDEDDNGIIMWWDVMMIVLGCAPFLFSCCLSIKSIKKERRVPPSSFAFLWWTTCCLCGGLVLVLVLALWPGLVVWSGLVLCRVLSYSSTSFPFLVASILGLVFFLVHYSHQDADPLLSLYFYNFTISEINSMWCDLIW